MIRDNKDSTRTVSKCSRRAELSGYQIVPLVARRYACQYVIQFTNCPSTKKWAVLLLQPEVADVVESEESEEEPSQSPPIQFASSNYTTGFDIFSNRAQLSFCYGVSLTDRHCFSARCYAS